MWPMVAAAGVSALGGIASTLLGSRGGGSVRDSLETQYELERKRGPAIIRSNWRANMAAAKEAGIHPLAAIGAPVSSGSFTPVGSTSSGSAIGDGIGVASEAAADGLREYGRDRANKPALEAAERRAEAESAASVAESNARARYYDAQTLGLVTEKGLIQSTARRMVSEANFRQDGPEVKQTLSTPLGPFKPSNTSKQQDVEDNYGGIVGETYGLWRYLNDLFSQERKPQTFNRRGDPGTVAPQGLYPELY